MKIYYSFFTAALLFISPLASAKPPSSYSPLQSSQYKSLLSGKTIKGEYRFMDARSKTYNFTEHHNADGTTHYTEGDIKTPGVWYTLGKRKICYKYPKDSGMSSGISCFWIYQSQTCYYGYGVRQMSPNGPRNFDNWTARWVIKGDGGNCGEPVS